MKVVSKDEGDAHYNAVLKAGLIGGAVGLGVGFGSVALAGRRYPGFKTFSIPVKAFLVSSSGLFGANFYADRTSIEYLRERDPKRFIDSTKRALELARENETNYDKFMNYCREHRYNIVLVSWIASMGLAFALVSRSPMNTANKLVQARVYAQGLTLAVLIVTAAFEMNDAKKGSGRWQTIMVVDPNDPEHKHLIEKKIHKEEYEGQDLWMDMVEAEERRLAAKKALVESKQAAETKA